MKNSILLNLTVQIDAQFEDALISDLQAYFIPQIVDAERILSGQILKIDKLEPDQLQSYALQFEYLDLETYRQYKLDSMRVLLQKIDEKYRGKYVYFVTSMEKIFYKN